uniref:Uncharacterized protein n=1 Tax=Prolemur simus TaxID=1328070 RepID=A0A8C8YWG3_PROSS
MRLRSDITCSKSCRMYGVQKGKPLECEQIGGACKHQKTHGCSILPAECKSRYKHCCRL